MVKKKNKKRKNKYGNKWIVTILIIIIILLIIGLIYQDNPDIFKRSKKDNKTNIEQAEPSEKPINKKEKRIKKTDTDKKQETEAKPADTDDNQTEENKDKNIDKDNKTETEAKPANTDDNQTKEKQDSVTEAGGKQEPETKPANTNVDSINEIKIGIKDLEVPAELIDRPSQIIRHAGYIVSYNKDWKIPNWVAYELTREETQGDVKRTNKFVVDPNVKSNSATNSDYSKSGYDRGHMAPAGDMGWSITAMKESFYFSNMCPQVQSFNRGIWKNLEEKCRDWAVKDSAIIIVTGPINIGEEKTIGSNRVLVPSHFYKAILSPFGEKAKAIGFIMKNEGTLNGVKKFAVPIDSIEKLTNMDLFHLLPDSIEEIVEANYTLSDWF